MADVEVAFINLSTIVNDAEARRVMAALQRQVLRDFAPVWGVDARLRFVRRGQRPPPGAWWLAILDDAKHATTLGVHDKTDEGLPLGKVFARTAQQNKVPWSIPASHELLEMLVDPEINLSVFVQTSGTHGVLYSYEVCDACQGTRFAYEIDGVKVSNFVYPTWFQSFRRPGSARFDHRRRLKRPVPHLLSGGYIGAFKVGGRRAKGGWRMLRAGGGVAEAPRGTRRHRRSLSPTKRRNSDRLG